MSVTRLRTPLSLTRLEVPMSDLSLSALFALSDEIGDKYLSDEEIATRDAALAAEADAA
jgi:hypothetical protein